MTADECPTGKICFRSPQAAWDASGRIRKRSTGVGGSNRKRPSTAYKCPHCNLWHTTSHPEFKPVNKKPKST